MTMLQHDIHYGPSSTPARTSAAAAAALPIPDQQADFANRQDTAASHIWSSLSASAQSLMKETINPSLMWTDLKKRYDNANLATGRINLRLKLFKERPIDSEPIANFISRLTTYQIQLQHTPQAVSDEDIILHILSVLPTTYAGVAPTVARSSMEAEYMAVQRPPVKLYGLKGYLLNL